VALWGLRVEFPNKMSAMGGHFMFDDDQETPNTLNAAFEFNQPEGKLKILEFEVPHWITNQEAGIGSLGFGVAIPGFLGPPPRNPSGPRRVRVSGSVGNIFYGSKGYMAMSNEEFPSYRTWLGEEQERGSSGSREGNNWQNFINCVRSRKKEELNAPIEEGYISCALIHLANTSYGQGRTLNFDAETEQVIRDDEANKLLRGTYRAPYVVPEGVFQWGAHGHFGWQQVGAAGGGVGARTEPLLPWLPRGQAACSAFRDAKPPLEARALRKRREIFDWINGLARALIHAWAAHAQRRAETARRLAAEAWLRRNGATAIARNEKALPVFPEKFAHNKVAPTTSFSASPSPVRILNARTRLSPYERLFTYSRRFAFTPAFRNPLPVCPETERSDVFTASNRWLLRPSSFETFGTSAGAGVPGAVHRHHGVGALLVSGWAGIDVLRSCRGSNAHTVMVDAVVAQVRFGAGRPPQPVGSRRRSR